MADKLPEKVEKHVAGASAFPQDVQNVLAALTDEELQVLAEVRGKLDNASAPDHVKAQIV